jgi:hypothetical protein
MPFYIGVPSLITPVHCITQTEEPSLFGIKKIPCDNQIRNLLDPIPAATIFGSFQQVYQWLKKQGVIKKFFYLDEEILIALDGK